jgi:predicted DNA-binding transcriptional regulator AlpA
MLEKPNVLNTQGAAKHLGLSENTLNSWRSRQIGPRALRLGRRVVYRVSDLELWLSSRPSLGEQPDKGAAA